jgi:Sulfotransferase family
VTVLGAGGTLFVTGMQRSGTTLLEKLLHAHPELSVLSQPFPLLFVEVKRAFLESIGPSG